MFYNFTIPMAITAIVFTILLYYPRITKKETDPNPSLAIICMIAWFIAAVTTLHNQPERLFEGVFYGALAITCAYDLIHGLVGTLDNEFDAWALRG